MKQTIDRVLHYIDAETPVVLVDKRTGKEVTRPEDIDANIRRVIDPHALDDAGAITS